MCLHLNYYTINSFPVSQIWLEPCLKGSWGSSVGSGDRRPDGWGLRRHIYIPADQEHEKHPDQNPVFAWRHGPHQVNYKCFTLGREGSYSKVLVVCLFFWVYIHHVFAFFLPHSCKKVSRTWRRIICEDTAALNRCQAAEQELRVRKHTNPQRKLCSR